MREFASIVFHYVRIQEGCAKVVNKAEKKKKKAVTRCNHASTGSHSFQPQNCEK